MDVPIELRYTKTHEWVKQDGGEVIIGITAHAQEELRDVVFVELPKAGQEITQGAPAAVIESVKAAFEIYAPVSGTVVRINEAVAKSPQLVNEACYGAGWLFALTPRDAKALSTLLSADQYRQQLASPTSGH